MEEQNERWDKLTPIIQDTIRNEYKTTKDKNLEELFGKWNIEPQIRSWRDVIGKAVDECTDEEGFSNFDRHFIPRIWPIVPEEIYDRMEATLRIAKLMEDGYGGIITDKFDGSFVYVIMQRPILEEKVVDYFVQGLPYYVGDLLSFRSEELAKEFIRYNRKVLDMYFGY